MRGGVEESGGVDAQRARLDHGEAPGGCRRRPRAKRGQRERLGIIRPRLQTERHRFLWMQVHEPEEHGDVTEAAARHVRDRRVDRHVITCLHNSLVRPDVDPERRRLLRCAARHHRRGVHGAGTGEEGDAQDDEHEWR